MPAYNYRGGVMFKLFEFKRARLKTGWKVLAMLAFCSMANTALAVVIDLGEPANLHPPRKAEVGQRLTLVALRKVYDQSGEFSGPVPESASPEQVRFVLRFTHAEGLATSNGTDVEGFAVAGEDRKFFPAKAESKGSQVIVSSPSVPIPAAVRYAWSSSLICNLINSARLPAAPFRSDHWPGLTEEAR